MKKIEETALAVRAEEGIELAPTVSAEMVRAEIESAIVMAIRRPRNEDAAYERLIEACRRPRFAENSSYQFPRAGQQITGPSIHLAREAARVWGNMRHGLNVVADDDESRTIEAWAWDLEANDKVYAQDTFKKLIPRKQHDDKGNYLGTTWKKPDERDLRELTNRRGAILKRNCILELMPSDLIEDAQLEAKNTLQKNVGEDPDSAKKKIIAAFSDLNVTVEMLEEKLAHKIAQCSPTEIAELRQIYKSIYDGNSTWREYVKVKERPREERGSLDMKDLKPKQDSDIKTITQKQANRLWKIARDKGFTDAEIDSVVKKQGYEHKSDIPMGAEYERIIGIFENAS